MGVLSSRVIQSDRMKLEILFLFVATEIKSTDEKYEKLSWGFYKNISDDLCITR